MKNLPLTVRQIAEIVGGSVEGDGSVSVAGIAATDSAGAGELTFASDERRARQLAKSSAAAAIVGKEPAQAPMPLVRVENVQAALARLLAYISDDEDLPAGVHPSAVIAPDAKIGKGFAAGPYVVVGSGATIGDGCVLCAGAKVGARCEVGDGCVLFDGVVLRPGSVVGNRVRIGPNSVIGWDGFGYYFEGGVHRKIAHAGNVVIGDDVEIGACTCIDKGKFGSTRIGAGTKIDNLVQVAHNVQTGKGCILVGQCGVAGSTTLGDYVVLGGGAGIKDNIKLGDGVQCSAMAGVTGDIEPGQTVIGYPAMPERQGLRVWLSMPKLPDLVKRVRELESRLSELESSKNH